MPGPSCRRLDTNRGLYPNTQFEVAPTTDGAALVGSDAISSMFEAVVQKFPFLAAPVFALLAVLAAVGLVTPTGALANPWTPQVGIFM